jgi:hypothetical protein
MSGNKLWFTKLDKEFRHSVKLGNNSRMAIIGKGMCETDCNWSNVKDWWCLLHPMVEKQFAKYRSTTGERPSNTYSKQHAQTISSN